MRHRQIRSSGNDTVDALGMVFLVSLAIALFTGLAHREGAFDSPAPRTADQITAEKLTKAYFKN